MHASRRRPRVGIWLALVVLAIPAYAHAQLGGLAKRAAKAAAERAVDKKVDEKVDQAIGTGDGRAVPTPAATYGQPFTEESLGAMLAGYDRALATSVRNDTLRLRRDALYERAEALRKGREKEQDRVQEAEERWRECADEAIAADVERQREALTARIMRDAEMQKKIQQVAMEQASAAQRGDTAALKRLEKRMVEIGLEPKPDSSVAAVKCGAAPAVPQWLAEHRRVARDADQVNDELRKTEHGLHQIAEKASGMDARRFALARERLMLWRGLNAASRAKTFGEEERALLEREAARLERLRMLL